MAAHQPALDTVKLQYISQNYSRGTAILAILFLPGIFVSVSKLTLSPTDQTNPKLSTTNNLSQTLLSTGILSPSTQTSTYITVWLAIAIPLTVLAITVLWLLWQAPIVNEQLKQNGFKGAMEVLFPSLMKRDRGIRSEV
jgi:putative effector of murein hydrolase LrgA (UPF0299 family)